MINLMRTSSSFRGWRCKASLVWTNHFKIWVFSWLWPWSYGDKVLGEGLRLVVGWPVLRASQRWLRDIYWFSGYIVALVQLGIALIPAFIWDEWDAFLITCIGTALAFITGLLPQWRRERWACRMPTNSRKCRWNPRGLFHCTLWGRGFKSLWSHEWIWLFEKKLFFIMKGFFVQIWH